MRLVVLTILCTELIRTCVPSAAANECVSASLTEVAPPQFMFSANWSRVALANCSFSSVTYARIKEFLVTRRPTLSNNTLCTNISYSFGNVSIRSGGGNSVDSMIVFSCPAQSHRNVTISMDHCTAGFEDSSNLAFFVFIGDVSQFRLTVDSLRSTYFSFVWHIGGPWLFKEKMYISLRNSSFTNCPPLIVSVDRQATPQAINTTATIYWLFPRVEALYGKGGTESFELPLFVTSGQNKTLISAAQEIFVTLEGCSCYSDRRPNMSTTTQGSVPLWLGKIGDLVFDCDFAFFCLRDATVVLGDVSVHVSNSSLVTLVDAAAGRRTSAVNIASSFCTICRSLSVSFRNHSTIDATLVLQEPTSTSMNYYARLIRLATALSLSHTTHVTFQQSIVRVQLPRPILMKNVAEVNLLTLDASGQADPLMAGRVVVDITESVVECASNYRAVLISCDAMFGVFNSETNNSEYVLRISQSTMSASVFGNASQDIGSIAMSKQAIISEWVQPTNLTFVTVEMYKSTFTCTIVTDTLSSAGFVDNIALTMIAAVIQFGSAMHVSVAVAECAIHLRLVQQRNAPYRYLSCVAVLMAFAMTLNRPLVALSFQAFDVNVTQESNATFAPPAVGASVVGVTIGFLLVPPASLGEFVLNVAAVSMTVHLQRNVAEITSATMFPQPPGGVWAALVVLSSVERLVHFQRLTVDTSLLFPSFFSSFQLSHPTIRLVSVIIDVTDAEGLCSMALTMSRLSNTSDGAPTSASQEAVDALLLINNDMAVVQGSFLVVVNATISAASIALDSVKRMFPPRTSDCSCFHVALSRVVTVRHPPPSAAVVMLVTTTLTHSVVSLTHAVLLEAPMFVAPLFGAIRSGAVGGSRIVVDSCNASFVSPFAVSDSIIASSSLSIITSWGCFVDGYANGNLSRKNGSAVDLSSHWRCRDNHFAVLPPLGMGNSLHPVAVECFLFAPLMYSPHDGPFVPAGGIVPWGPGSTVSFSCRNRWFSDCEGFEPTMKTLGFVPRGVLVVSTMVDDNGSNCQQQRDLLGLVSASKSISVSRQQPVPLQRSLMLFERVLSPAVMLTAVTAQAALTAVSGASACVSVLPAAVTQNIRLSSFVLAAIGRCGTKALNEEIWRNVTGSDKQGNPDNDDEQLSSSLLDNPTQISISSLQPALQYAGGAVFGNWLLIAVWVIATDKGLRGAVLQSCRGNPSILAMFKRSNAESSAVPGNQRLPHLRGVPWSVAVGNVLHRSHLPGSVATPYGLFLQPIVVASVALIAVGGRDGDGGASAVGWVSIVPTMVPMILFAWRLVVTLRPFPFHATRSNEEPATPDGESSIVVLLKKFKSFFQTRYVWTTRRRGSSSMAALFYHYIGVFGGYRDGAHWYFCVDFGIASLACGIVMGIASGMTVKSTSEQCNAVVLVCLWALVALSTVVTALAVVIRPAADSFTNAIVMLSNGITVAVAILTIYSNSETQSIIVLLTYLQTALSFGGVVCVSIVTLGEKLQWECNTMHDAKSSNQKTLSIRSATVPQRDASEATRALLLEVLLGSTDARTNLAKLIEAICFP